MEPVPATEAGPASQIRSISGLRGRIGMLKDCNCDLDADSRTQVSKGRRRRFVSPGRKDGPILGRDRPLGRYRPHEEPLARRRRIRDVSAEL